jgi:hypothetical protein
MSIHYCVQGPVRNRYMYEQSVLYGQTTSGPEVRSLKDNSRHVRSIVYAPYSPLTDATQYQSHATRTPSLSSFFGDRAQIQN